MGIGNNLERVTHDDLQEAAVRGNIPLIRQLIRAGASVNAPMRPESDDEFMTLLHILAMKPELPNGTQVISEIIRGRANLNVRSSLGSTPLSCACSTKHTGAVETLLEAKADASPADDKGCTAVRCAVMPPVDLGRSSQVSGRLEPAGVAAKCVDVLKLLVASGADLDDGGDVPPIVEAVRSLSGDAVTALLEGGATPDGLHDAVAKAPIPMIAQLIEAEANPFKKDRDGKSVMEVALTRGDEEITTMLRNFVGDLQRKNHPHCLTQAQTQSFGDYEAGKYEGNLRRSRTVNTNMSQQNLGRCGKICGRRVARYHAERVQPFFRRLQMNKVFEVSMFVVLIVALFLPDIWVLSDINNDQVLDICLTVIMAAFLMELIIQMIGFPDTYTFSFFFWMDLIGLLSVPMDHSLVVNALPTSLDNAVVLRAARMAKLGARASRFTKLVKFLRFLPGMKETANAGTAKVISRSLNMALSTRVSCLIVLMVIVLPLFELAAYPQYDFSMAMWLDLIHDTAYKYPDEVVEVVGDFEVFYRGRSYFPFEIVWDYQNGTTQSLALSGGAPNHRRSEIKVKGDAGSTYAMFNFRGAHQIDSLCNVLLILTIMLMMLGSGLVLSNSVSSIVLTPLEELLGNVKKIASKIFTSVASIEKGRKRSKDHAQTDDQADGGGLGAETELLDRVLKKLTALSEITVKKSPLDSEAMERLGEADAEMLKSYSVAECLKVHHDEYQEADFVAAVADLPAMQTIQQQLTDSDVSWSVLDDWDFDSFKLSNAQRRAAVRAVIVMRHEHISEGSFLGDWATTCTSFVEGVQRGYTSPSTVPYHNWMHAVDATLAMNVMLDLCVTGLYFTAYERFALAVAAVAHDIGHPGMNNQFLAQTSHPLAVRYNDSSPLENHHCATLFELASQPGMAIFGDLEKDRYKEVRHYVIEAILATDYSRHLNLVQQVETLYEMNKELFDTSDEMYRTGVSDFPSREVVDFFRRQDVKRHIRTIFLHYCDTSNPMKSFDVAQSWADIILEEFFMLGDREKERKIPVQPLNDRDQVNKAFSQVSFIEFFIAPMGIAMVRIIPDLRITVDSLLANLEMWFDLWVRDTDPPPADDERARVAERIVKLQAMYPYFDPTVTSQLRGPAAASNGGSTPLSS
jgi:ankyrin repeat protein